MQLDGIHHITCITANAQENVDFYARVLGLRLVRRRSTSTRPTSTTSTTATSAARRARS